MDRLSPEQRHKNMQAIKCKGSKIELILQKELWKRGLRYRKNYRKVPGVPDLVFVRMKVAVFCDSEFWHGFDWENRKKDFKSNQNFWLAKIERNMQRDIEVTGILQKMGWTVIRFWGKEIKNNVQHCADIIEKVIKDKKNNVL